MLFLCVWRTERNKSFFLALQDFLCCCFFLCPCFFSPSYIYLYYVSGAVKGALHTSTNLLPNTRMVGGIIASCYIWGIWWTEKLSNFRKVTQLISGRLGFILLQPVFKIHASTIYNLPFVINQYPLYFSELSWITVFAKNYLDYFW